MRSDSLELLDADVAVFNVARCFLVGVLQANITLERACEQGLVRICGLHTGDAIGDDRVALANAVDLIAVPDVSAFIGSRVDCRQAVE